MAVNFGIAARLAGVRGPDRGEPERLRCLTQAQQVPRQHVRDPVSIMVDLDHRVGGGDRGVHRAVVGQGGHVGGDDLLRDQRPGGVVQQDVALLNPEGGQRNGGGSGSGQPGPERIWATLS